jgi:hypothetical protein
VKPLARLSAWLARTLDPTPYRPPGPPDYGPDYPYHLDDRYPHDEADAPLRRRADADAAPARHSWLDPADDEEAYFWDLLYGLSERRRARHRRPPDAS